MEFRAPILIESGKRPFPDAHVPQQGHFSKKTFAFSSTAFITEGPLFWSTFLVYLFGQHFITLFQNNL